MSITSNIYIYMYTKQIHDVSLAQGGKPPGGKNMLYLLTKIQFIKERNKFVNKFGALDSNKAKVARSQNINKEILSSTQSI